ncbi:unnamed protein product, partial [Discosporangium mesarthrocarpum]
MPHPHVLWFFGSVCLSLSLSPTHDNNKIRSPCPCMPSCFLSLVLCFFLSFGGWLSALAFFLIHNKVIMSTHAVVANGGLVALNGSNAVAQAAKELSVPVVCVTG